MANAVLIQNPNSIYKDEPGVCYHFPKQYLRRVEACQGDWVIFYEGKKGALGYTSVQRVREVTSDPELKGHYFAWLDQGTLWQFESVVARNNQMGIAYEESLRDADGRAMSGGYAVSAVRAISFEEFTAIVTAGLRPLKGPDALPRDADAPGYMASGMAEDGAAPFEYPGLAEDRASILSSRDARDQSFARLVKAAYRGRCAISGLDLRNGSGRSEVQAAHIRPVKYRGPDVVTNGLALSGTLHWMFDRGLISVGENYEILVSENKVPQDVRERLISPTGQLHLPKTRRDYPHPEYLKFHRENVFGGFA